MRSEAAAGNFGVRRPNADTFKGNFNFCRLAFRSSYGGFGGGWGVDYPRADQNLSIRLSELSVAAVDFAADGTPNYVVLQAIEPELFKCPFVMVTNHGNAFFAPEEVAALRAYLQKGGFLWADDAWGSRAWEHWHDVCHRRMGDPAQARKTGTRWKWSRARWSEVRAPGRRDRCWPT